MCVCLIRMVGCGVSVALYVQSRQGICPAPYTPLSSLVAAGGHVPNKFQ